MSENASRLKKLERNSTSTDRSKARISRDPVAFARSLGFEPDPWQRDLLTSTDERVILNCSRQSGKSTSVAILALHHALTTPGSVVLILSVAAAVRAAFRKDKHLLSQARLAGRQ